jgi:hypothetical protein
MGVQAVFAAVGGCANCELLKRARWLLREGKSATFENLFACAYLFIYGVARAESPSGCLLSTKGFYVSGDALL